MNRVEPEVHILPVLMTVNMNPLPREWFPQFHRVACSFGSDPWKNPKSKRTTIILLGCEVDHDFEQIKQLRNVRDGIAIAVVSSKGKDGKEYRKKALQMRCGFVHTKPGGELKERPFHDAFATSFNVTSPRVIWGR